MTTVTAVIKLKRIMLHAAWEFDARGEYPEFLMTLPYFFLVY
jgi:hypothetical protein